MPFDANLELHDGTTITGTITPISLTRTSGSVVIDMLALSSTPAKGMGAVLIIGTDLATAGNTIAVTIDHSDTEGSGYVQIANFPTLTKGTGMPGTYITRFNTTLQYVRALITVTGTSYSAANVYILLAYHPFHVL